MYNWTSTQTTQHLTYTLDSTVTEDEPLKKAIEACAEKSISFLKENIEESSLYLLFEWSVSECTLKIVVTDATKSIDASIIIEGYFSNLRNQSTNVDASIHTSEEVADKIQFWLHDYLTTCTAFFNYSLVAIFHKSTRNATMLL